MSRLTELIAQVRRLDTALADDLGREVEVLGKLRSYGLNFERHIPESFQLPNRTIRSGDKIVFRDGADGQPWVVVGFEGKGSNRKAQLVRRGEEQKESIAALSDIVVVAEYREPMYPGLRSTGVVQRGGDKPYHTVINGENYHVLKALDFVCRGQVDCIYIDPPYNTRDKDWKYNNYYVDSDDKYQHSKWLAMMERRLLLSKALLRPDNSALIVTINEREYLRLGLLLDQTFPEATSIQMVTSVVSAKGAVRRGEFSRVEEHIFYVLFGDAQVRPWISNMLDTAETELDAENGDLGADAPSTDDMASAVDDHYPPIEWLGLRRREPSSIRGSRRNQFFPIFVDPRSGSIQSVGDPVADDVDRNTVKVPAGAVAVWPLRPSGDEMIWGVTPEAARSLLDQGFLRVNRWNRKRAKGTVQYLPSGTIAAIRRGDIRVTGHRPDGSVEGVMTREAFTPPKRVWNMRSHNAETGGTKMLSALIPGRRFDYPKSLYAVEDTLRFVVADKPEALILDFFAGSATTAHAVMRLNEQDGGRRRSIMVTNNEVSADEASALRQQGLAPGDVEWERLGICEHITNPRVRAAITGETPEGEPINGRYRFLAERLIADGFEENAEFFDLTYVDAERVRYGLGFEEIAALLWLRAGAEGERVNSTNDTFAMAQTYAVLFNVDAAAAFVAAVRGSASLRTAYIVIDDETQFQVIASELPQSVRVVRLYAAYLDNARVQTEA